MEVSSQTARGAAVVGFSAGFGDGMLEASLEQVGGDACDEAEVGELVEGEVVRLGEAGEDVEGEAFAAGFGGGVGNEVKEVVGGVWVGVGDGWVDGVVGGGGWLVVEGPGQGVGGGCRWKRCLRLLWASMMCWICSGEQMLRMPGGRLRGAGR